MKIYPTSTGPFIERPYYDTEEIERICFDELQKTKLLPSEPKPVRIDRFIEKRFKIDIDYGDLPEGVLGLIEFGPKGVQRIAISRALDEENSRISERRINTTLAHEGGHGLLHTHLFVLGEKPLSLFGNDSDSNEPRILCRGETIQGAPAYREKKYDGRWWEHQANLAIGPLLIPRRLLKIFLQPFLISSGRLGINETIDPGRRDEAVRMVAEVFNVNPIVARIRMDTIFPTPIQCQMTL